MLLIKRIFLLLILFSIVNANSTQPYLVDFQSSIDRHGIDTSFYLAYLQHPDSLEAKIIRVLEHLYTNNLRADNPPHSIPKIIHQIWLGSPVPFKYTNWMETWCQWHGWEYYLWTDQEVEDLNLMNQSLYNKTKNYGAKADILRYEILYQRGGIYVDIDFECLKQPFFEWASDHFDLFACIEIMSQAPLVYVGNAIIGAKPGHPLLLQMLKNLQQETRPPVLWYEILNVTGPRFFTLQLYEYYYQNQEVTTRDIAFTPTYLYPLSRLDVRNNRREGFIWEESAAIHYWTGEWVK